MLEIATIQYKAKRTVKWHVCNVEQRRTSRTGNFLKKSMYYTMYSTRRSCHQEMYSDLYLAPRHDVAVQSPVTWWPPESGDIEHTPDHQPGLVTPRVTAPETVEGHRYSTRPVGGTGASEDQIGGSSRLPKRPAAGTFAFRLFWFSREARLLHDATLSRAPCTFYTAGFYLYLYYYCLST